MFEIITENPFKNGLQKPIGGDILDVWSQVAPTVGMGNRLLDTRCCRNGRQSHQAVQGSAMNRL